MAVQTFLKIRAEWNETGTGDLGTPRNPQVLERILEMVNGTSDGQADLIWTDTRSLSTATEDLDLTAVLKDSFGDAISWAEVTGMWFKLNTETSGVYLQIGAKGATAFLSWCGSNADFVKVGPKGDFILTSPVDGFAVTASTADILQVEAVGAASYSVAIWGRSA